MIKKFQEYFKESISFPTSEDQVVQLCRQYDIQNYSINPDLSIDVEGSVHLGYLKLSSLPLRFSRIGGDFACHNNQLTTLEGGPRGVGGHFDCSYNFLTTLEGGPIEVGRNFHCNYNNLTTLKGGPREVGGIFNCRNNPLTTLESGPREVGRDFYCSNNPVFEIVDKFPDRNKVLKFWDDFNVVRNGNKISAYRFKEMYFDLTGKEFEGDMRFSGYKVVE